MHSDMLGKLHSTPVRIRKSRDVEDRDQRAKKDKARDQTTTGPTNNAQRKTTQANSTRLQSKNSFKLYNYKGNEFPGVTPYTPKKDFSPEISGRRKGAGTEQG